MSDSVKRAESQNFESDKHLKKQLKDKEEFDDYFGNLTPRQRETYFRRLAKDIGEMSTAKKACIFFGGFGLGIGLTYVAGNAMKRPADDDDGEPAITDKFSLDLNKADNVKILDQFNASELVQMFGSVANVNEGNVKEWLNTQLDDIQSNSELYVSHVDHTAPEGNGYFNVTINDDSAIQKFVNQVNNSISNKIYRLGVEAKGMPVTREGGKSPAYIAKIVDLIELREEINSLAENYTSQKWTISDESDVQYLADIVTKIPALQGDLINKINMGDNISAVQVIDTQDDAPGTPGGGGGVVVVYNKTGDIIDLYVLGKEDIATFVENYYGREQEGTRSMALPEESAYEGRKAKHGLTRNQKLEMKYSLRDLENDMKERGMETITRAKLAYNKFLVTGQDEEGNKEIYTVRPSGVYRK